jgi:hypothetical protein
MSLKAALLATILVICAAGPFAQQRQPVTPPSKPPIPTAPQQPESQQALQDRIPEGRGTEQKPIVVKVLPTEKSAAERAQEDRERQQKETSDTRIFWLTIALVAVGALQFLALIIQAVVFGVQARRLRQSVDLSRDIASQQQQDMAASIAAASRAATAMEGVAAGIAESVENSRNVIEQQRRFAQLQMRPYVSVTDPGYVPEDLQRGLCAGIQVWIVNTGHSPAHNFRFAARTRILPFPLPDDFDFTVPDDEIMISGHINPGQRFYIRRVIDRLLTPQETQDVTLGNGVRLYIHGSIFYTDVFNVEHRTNFSQFGVWDTAGRFSAINTTRHNDAT